MRKLFSLFFTFFFIALCIIGGGLAILPVADEICSKKRHWTRPGELLENLAFFQMFPGIIAGHCAVYVGRRVAGFIGAAIALFGVILPSVLVFTLVSIFYDAIPTDNAFLLSAFSGSRAALTGIILAMAFVAWKKLSNKPLSFFAIAITVFALFCGLPAPVIVVCGVICALLITTIKRARGFCSLLPLLIFLQYGALAFGGGYVLIPFYLQDFVGPSAQFLNLSEHEFANVVSLTQITPGPVGINGATFFGYRLYSVLGAIIASVFLVLPGFVILFFALKSIDRWKNNLYVSNVLKALKPISVGFIIFSVWSFLGMSVWTRVESAINIDFISLLIVIFAFAMSLLRKIGVVQIIFSSAFLYLVISYFLKLSLRI